MKTITRVELKKLQTIINTTSLLIARGNADGVAVGKRKLQRFNKLVLRRHGCRETTHTINFDTGEIVPLPK